MLLSCVFFAPYISARFRAFLCIQMHPSRLTSSHLLRIIRALLLILRAFWHILRASFTASRAQPACAFCAIHSTPTSLMCTRDAFCICIPTSHSVRTHVHLGSISHQHFVRTQAHCMCFLAHSVQLAVLLACLRATANRARDARGMHKNARECALTRQDSHAVQCCRKKQRAAWHRRRGFGLRSPSTPCSASRCAPASSA